MVIRRLEIYSSAVLIFKRRRAINYQENSNSCRFLHGALVVNNDVNVFLSLSLFRCSWIFSNAQLLLLVRADRSVWLSSSNFVRIGYMEVTLFFFGNFSLCLNRYRTYISDKTIILILEWLQNHWKVRKFSTTCVPLMTSTAFQRSSYLLIVDKRKRLDHSYSSTKSPLFSQSDDSVWFDTEKPSFLLLIVDTYADEVLS